MEILDPQFRAAVAAIDAGDVGELEGLIAAHPRLLSDRDEGGGGPGLEYFRRPYLLWFVAENPIRNGKLPGNIVAVTRALLEAARRERIASLSEQAGYALALVCSGRIPRECGVQLELIDLLLDAGADSNGALVPALAHRELAAVERLLERGATWTLLAAVCLDRAEEAKRLANTASPAERQLALTGAALLGRARYIALLADLGADVSAYGPPDFHPHATVLHHAVDSGSLETVRALVDAGADLTRRDRFYNGIPLAWAAHLRRPEILAYLREQGRRRGDPAPVDP